MSVGNLLNGKNRTISGLHPRTIACLPLKRSQIYRGEELTGIEPSARKCMTEICQTLVEKIFGHQTEYLADIGNNFFILVLHLRRKRENLASTISTNMELPFPALTLIAKGLNLCIDLLSKV